MTETTKVLVNFIQDRSGSMASNWDETLNGFKVFVKELKEKSPQDSIEYLFSLTVFDTLIETPLIAVPVESVDVNILGKHGPRGSTALYDAVGTTIKNTDDNRHGCKKIICVVVTDGQENSSREWNKTSLHAAVESHLNAGDWTFTYLGTQPETWGDAHAVGMGVGTVASYQPAHAAAAYAATAHAVNTMSASTSLNSRSLMRDYVTPDMEKSACMVIDRTTPDDLTGPGSGLTGASGIAGQSSWTKPSTTAVPQAQTSIPVTPPNKKSGRRWN